MKEPLSESIEYLIKATRDVQHIDFRLEVEILRMNLLPSQLATQDAAL